MKTNQNIIYIQQSNASPLPLIERFHAKAHCLRSRAIRDFVNKLLAMIAGLPARFVDYRRTRQLYKELYAMDKQQLRDIGLTRNDVERIRLGKAGVLAIQQDYAAVRLKNSVAKPPVIEPDRRAALPRAEAG